MQGGRAFGDESGFRPERAGIKRRGFFKQGKCLGGSEQDAIRNQRAVLAGKAVGIFGNLKEAVENMVAVKERTEPNLDNQKIYEEGYERYQELFQDLSGCFEKSI
mgnify:CR=1 FL=1